CYAAEPLRYQNVVTLGAVSPVAPCVGLIQPGPLRPHLGSAIHVIRKQRDVAFPQRIGSCRDVLRVKGNSSLESVERPRSDAQGQKTRGRTIAAGDRDRIACGSCSRPGARFPVETERVLSTAGRVDADESQRPRTVILGRTGDGRDLDRGLQKAAAVFPLAP